MAPSVRPPNDLSGPQPTIATRGRPRTRPLPDPNKPKRPRGRPKKGVSGTIGITGTTDITGTFVKASSFETIDDDSDLFSEDESQKTPAPTGKIGRPTEDTVLETQAARRKGVAPPSWLLILDAGRVERTLKQEAETSFAANDHAETQEHIIESIVKFKNGIQEWHDLWVMLLNIFQSSPYDLFTWGLRETEWEQKPELYRHLGHLLSHPLWAGDISRLRYSLQKAISLRVAGHLEPLGPLPPKIAKAITLTKMDPSEKAKLALEIWHSSETGPLQIEHSFFEELRWQVGRQSHFGQLDDDGTLFQLSVTDIEAIHHALDSMALRKKFSGLTVASHHAIYSSYMYTKRNRSAPVDKATLERWDRWSLQSRQSDESNWQQPDYPRRDREIYNSLPYWKSDTCDPRFWESMCSKVSSMKLIEERDIPRNSSAYHVAKKVKIEDDVVDLTQDNDNNNDTTAGIKPLQNKYISTGTTE
ncbi:hypothetical protein E8E14_002156 [Neopestalotiopsis sp. 37M]|nr:hypothetical protein E8E14_002156 [Neopestalotiopsis sp. 37M]